MTTLLAAAVLLSPQSANFFPLESGQTWEYLITVASSIVRVRQVQKTLPSQTFDGAPATPLEMYLDGKIDTTGYYRVVGGFVCLVGFTGTTQLSEPIKVVPTDPKKGQKWAFEGQQMMLGGMVTAKVESKITTDAEAEVFGKKIRCITIETKSSLGEGDMAFTSVTTEVYGAGIGLVNRRQESTPGKNSKRKSIALTTLVRHDKEGG